MTPTLGRARLCLLVTVAALALAACTSPQQRMDRDQILVQRSAYTINQFKQADPSISRFFDRSVGYVVFPDVTKGGVGVGAAHGKGVVYERGQVVGFADLIQGTIGLQLGGQMYSQIVFLQTPFEMQRLKGNAFEFAAGATAVMSARGAATQVNYSDGVAVFVADPEGVMVEAALGGQRFTFRPR